MTGQHCVCWSRVNLRPASRNISELNASWVTYFIQRVVCAESTCGAYIPVMSLCCIQVRAPARATVTRITAAAPRSVRWSEDWSSAPVTLDTDWWTMAKPARVLLCLCVCVCVWGLVRTLVWHHCLCLHWVSRLSVNIHDPRRAWWLVPCSNMRQVNWVAWIRHYYKVVLLVLLF